MSSVYVYAVSYDLGFAPNPFDGICSLACCKPRIRAAGKPGDWIIGLTGTSLPPALRCVFAMFVTKAITFDEYWAGTAFSTRKAQRAGSLKKQVGDNIYHRADPTKPWVQEDSVHSLESGAQCDLNTAHDTRVNRILLSDRFIYFGAAAPSVPKAILNSFGYTKNPRDYCKFEDSEVKGLLDWLKPQIGKQPNRVVDDPINFDDGSKRYSYRRKKMI